MTGPLVFRWRVPALAAIAPLEQLPPASDLAIVVGPAGAQGLRGFPGEDANADPGDLTLIFENRLI